MGEGSEPVPGRRTTRLVSNTLIRGSAQVASVIASFVLLPFLVRAFTLADYGVFMLASAVTGYAALLDLGVGATLVRMVAERLARGESDEVGPVIASGASFYAVAGVIAALIMVGIGVLGGALFAVSPAQAKLLAQLLAIGAFVQLFYWPASAATHALAGFERYDLLSAASVVQTVCSVIAVVVVLVTKTGPVALAAINAGITLAASLAYCLLLARVTRGKIGRIRPRVSLVRTVMRDGLPLFSLQISALLGRQATDRIVLGVFLGPVAVGVYEIAAKLSALVSQAADLLTGVILPVASNMNAQEHKESLRALFVRGARYSVAAIAPVVVILACIARPFIQAWFGPGMAAAAPVASVLLLSQLFVPLYLMGDPILIGMNRIGRWAGWGFFVAALNVVLSVVLVKAVGYPGCRARDRDSNVSRTAPIREGRCARGRHRLAAVAPRVFAAGLPALGGADRHCARCLEDGTGPKHRHASRRLHRCSSTVLGFVLDAGAAALGASRTTVRGRFHGPPPRSRVVRLVGRGPLPRHLEPGAEPACELLTVHVLGGTAWDGHPVGPRDDDPELRRARAEEASRRDDTLCVGGEAVWPAVRVAKGAYGRAAHLLQLLLAANDLVALSFGGQRREDRVGPRVSADLDQVEGAEFAQLGLRQRAMRWANNGFGADLLAQRRQRGVALVRRERLQQGGQFRVHLFALRARRLREVPAAVPSESG